MTRLIQRRRIITLMATGMAACMVPGRALALATALQPRPELHTWNGFALGAEVSLQIYHHDTSAARRIIQRSVEIIRQMEGLFSLYQPDSVISTLNRQGAVDSPPAAFVDLLRTAGRVSQMTSGAFDITVQPLWQYYDKGFSAGGNDFNPGTDGDLQFVRSLVDYQKLIISDQRVSFERKAMAATLNGIAQGYVTDRVSDYLKDCGMTSVLVDIGEYRALGPQADGSPWRIGLADPQHPGGLADILEITQGAVATSSGSGDRFDTSGDYHHLFDPTSGASANRYLSVTVTAPTATWADALSTAFCALPEVAIESCLKKLSSVSVRLTRADGSHRRL